MPGTFALVGGAEWRDGCDFDRDLLASNDAREVLVVPTAAAYEHPGRLIAEAERWFGGLNIGVRALPVLTRADAIRPENAVPVADAACIYLAGGSPMHLRSVLKDSPIWDALVTAWHAGATVIGSSAGAMVLCDPMVDPRGGALTLGLGLVERLAVIPHHDSWSEDKAKRTLHIAPKGLPIAGIDERTALIRDAAGSWRVEGIGRVVVFVDGQEADLSTLP